ncbi:MAG: hypothetical protein AAGG01_15085, partial [Planctomycetota bacterium]
NQLWSRITANGAWSASRDLLVTESGDAIASVSPYNTNAAAYTAAFAPNGAKLWEVDYLDVRDRLGLDRIIAAGAVEDSSGHIVTPTLGVPEVVLGGWTESFVYTVKLVPGDDPTTTACAAAAPNSTGALGLLSGAGSDQASSNDLSLVLRDLPPQTTVLLLASMSAGNHPMAGGSLGTLCLDGSIGRFLRPGELRTTNPEGSTSLAVDLGSLPSPTGSVAASAGQTWYFQAWHRDLAFTSNFTNSISITLQ